MIPIHWLGSGNRGPCTWIPLNREIPISFYDIHRNFLPKHTQRLDWSGILPLVLPMKSKIVRKYNKKVDCFFLPLLKQ